VSLRVIVSFGHGKGSLCHSVMCHLVIIQLSPFRRLPVNSSHGQLVTRMTRHAVDSSQRGGQLVTSKQTSKHQSRTAAAV